MSVSADVATNDRASSPRYHLLKKRQEMHMWAYRPKAGVYNSTQDHPFNLTELAAAKELGLLRKAIHAFGVAITAQRVIPDKRRKAEKHKKSLKEE